MKFDHEILQYAIDKGIIDVSRVQERVNMDKRKRILENHNHNVWQGKDGGWYTYVDVDGKRKLKRRNKKSDIEDFIYEFYTKDNDDENPTFRALFDSWLEYKLEMREISKTSADRYATDFGRFFVEDGLDEKRIMDVTEDELEDFIRKQIKKYELSNKTYNGLRLIIRGIYKHAKRKAPFSITQFFDDLEISRKSFKKNYKESSGEVFDEDETELLIKYLKQNNDVWNLGILLMIQTGLRVGELSALKPGDYDGGCILSVRRTEYRYKGDDGKNITSTKDFTKTESGMRDIILTDNGVETINKLIDMCDGIYLFENENGVRIRGNTFNKRLTNVEQKLGISHKSVHKLRKTYGTTLIDARIPDGLVAKQMGHKSIETTRKYYYYSRLARKNEIETIRNMVSL